MTMSASCSRERRPWGAPGYVSVREAARTLHVSSETVYRLMRSGHLTDQKIGSGHYVWRRGLLKFAERQVGGDLLRPVDNDGSRDTALLR